MASVGAVRPSVGFRNDTSTSGDAGHLPNQMSNMSIRDDQDPEDIVVNGNGTEPGHIIVTSIEGRNGQAKQTISYMAERVVGHGSFGTVMARGRSGDFYIEQPEEAIKCMRHAKRTVLTADVVDSALSLRNVEIAALRREGDSAQEPGDYHRHHGRQGPAGEAAQEAPPPCRRGAARQVQGQAAGGQQQGRLQQGRQQSG